MARIEVRHFAKRYGPIEAVRDVTFEVAAGEIFGLLGWNGAGKTSTIECLLGLRVPDAGTASLAGIDVLAHPSAAKAKIGAQLQAATLPDKMTPREALAYFGSFYSNPVPPDELLREFALEGPASAAFATLSGGQRQRLFLALAFVNRPAAVILDEPTSGLDPIARRELHELLRAARRRDVAILLSTHDLTEAAQLCDRVGILHEGRLVAVNTPAELAAGSGARARLVIRTARAVAGDFFAGEPAIASVTVDRQQVNITCLDATAALLAAVRRLGETGNALTEMRLEPPSLEDAFVRLTGSRWSEKEST